MKKGLPLEPVEWAAGADLKLAPSVAISDAGHLVNKPAVVEWENYFKNVLTNLNANQAFSCLHNWQPITATNSSNDQSAGYVRTDTGWILNADNGTDDTVFLLSEVDLSVEASVALTPGSGAFTPAVVAFGNGVSLVGGDNSIDDDAIWSSLTDVDNWTERTLTGITGSVFAIVYEPVNDEFLALTTSQEVYSSADGATWGAETAFSNVQYPNSYVVAAAGGYVAKAGWTGSDPYQNIVEWTDDGGATWNVTNVGSTYAGHTEDVIALSYSEQYEKWILVNEKLGVYTADTPGGTWTEETAAWSTVVSGAARIFGSTIVARFARTYGRYLVYSTDLGATWKSVGFDPSTAIVDVWATGNSIVVTNASGAWKSGSIANVDDIAGLI